MKNKGSFRTWLCRFGRRWRGGCVRCYSKKTYHITDYMEGRGCFPLCERCWSELTPEQRLPWYRKLWDVWNYGGFWHQWHDGSWHVSEACVEWDVIKRAVLEEGE